MDKIVVLGSTCNVSFALQRMGLKGPSSLFEWVVTDKMADINYILKDPIKNSVAVQKSPIHVGIENTEIFTGHYKLDEYKEIVKRRAQRLFDDIAKSTGKLLFIRRDSDKYPAKLEEIKEFFDLIKKINPKCDYYFLLIGASTKEEFKELKCYRLFHTFIDKAKIPYGEYWDVSGDITIWEKILESLNFNFTKYDTVHRDDKN